jgi:type II secretory pathway pseudopilin PulG
MFNVGRLVQKPKSMAGFSVIELMVLMAFLCIMLAIGVPNLVEMQHRARRAEVPCNLDAIRTAALAYESVNGEMVEERISRPDSNPGKRMRPWKNGSRFDELGWKPDGSVRGAYTISITKSDDFTVKGVCDVDGDGRKAIFTATKGQDARPESSPAIY